MPLQNYGSAIRNATFFGDAVELFQHKNVVASIDVTAVPGVDTVTLSIEHQVAGDNWVPVVGAAARAAVGRDVLWAGPDVTTAANQAQNIVLTGKVRAKVTHSAGTNFTYSVRLETRP